MKGKDATQTEYGHSFEPQMNQLLLMNVSLILILAETIRSINPLRSPTSAWGTAFSCFFC